MNRAVLSLCLFGTALATANTLITQRPSCPSGGANIVAAYAETSPGTVAAAHSAPAQAAKAKPAQAPKDQAVNPAPTKTEDTKPAAPNDLDQTGSVDQKTQKQSQKPAPLSQTELGDQQVKVGDDEQWAEVVLAARAHSAASVSSPTVRHYRVGTKLKVIDRKSGWIKVIDPTNSNQGWIFEKYLMLKEGPDKKQVEGPGSQRTAQAGSDDPNLVAPARPGPYARSYTRKQGWRRSYRYVWPPAGLAIRIYPGW
jgi:Bacterial SH3 domain